MSKVEESKEEPDLTLEELKWIQTGQLGAIVGKIIDYAMSKLVDAMLALPQVRQIAQQKGGISVEDVFKILDENADLLTYDVIDEAISKVPDTKIKVMINVSIRMANFFARRSDIGKAIRQRPEILMELLKNIRPDVYELLSKYPNLQKVLLGYIIYKIFT